MPTRRKDGRFDRMAWLTAALAVLARSGQATLNVEKLAADLGVTKGSFYHHFRDRGDFVEKLLEFWEEEYTNRQRRFLETGDAPPRERLFQIMRAVERENLTQYDTAFRSWAAQDAFVADVVRRVDSNRFESIKAIFAELGFEGTELVERSRIWLLFHSALSSVSVPDDTPVTDAMIRDRLRFFIQPRSSDQRRIPDFH